MKTIRPYYKALIVIFSFLVIVLIGIALYFGIPRLSYSYNETYKGYLVINAYGNAEEYKVEKEINGIPVVGIGDRAFYKHNKLKTITFDDSQNITIISRLAFSYCTSLKEIDLSSVTYIDISAFSYCSSLEDVSTSALSIGGSAFFKCTSLKSMSIDKTLYLGSMAFAYTNVEEIELAKDVKTIGDDLFYNCSNLKMIKAPISLKKNEYLLSLGELVKFE